MKPSFKKIVPVLFLFIFTILSDCDILVSSDKCDATVLNPSINVTLKANVHFTQIGKNVPYESAKVIFHKLACGEDDYKPGGDFEFYGNTNSEGAFTSGIVNYNLRNEMDEIVIEAYHSDDDPLTVGEQDRKYNLMKTFVYRAEDFASNLDGYIKEIQFYITLK